MDPVVVGTFIFVYVGMILGKAPGIRLDRPGIAMIGAIVLIVSGRLTTTAAWNAIDVSTIVLLLGLMIISAQFRLAGFYTRLTEWLGGAAHSTGVLLAGVIVAAGVLSAVFANDIVCLAMAPLVIDVCARRRLNPIPFLLALACASNVGSAATLIGNPQNMLIGQTLQLSFSEYLVDAAVPSIGGLGVVWLCIWIGFRHRWPESENAYAPGSQAAARADKVRTRLQHGSAPRTSVAALPIIPFDRWQTIKGTIVVTLTMIAFLFTDWPREVVALGAAGALLVSRKMASREMLSQIDWPLIVLFVGLFIVNRAIAQSGLVHGMLSMSRMAGLDWTDPRTLFAGTALLSNIVSNVPAVMLLLPAARDEVAGAVLALSSTFAGNLLIAGSIANLIVVDQAAKLGLVIDWKAHARVGVPVALVSLALAAAWLLVVRA